MKPTLVTSPRKFPFRAALALVVVCLVSLAVVTPSSQAQESSGSIRGHISNQATGNQLEGARVTLEPGSRAALTERDGGFSFSGLPAGSYRLAAYYTGLDPQEVTVEIRAGERVVRDIGLSAQIYQLSTFTVTGEREGSALAVTLQRNAPNVKSIMSADAFGNIADGNIGNFLQRLPGMSVVEDEGEIYRVMVRGVSADLNSVSIDGTRIANATTRGAAANAMGRAIEIDKLPADYIERIEVTKAMTPDMDADSIGGAINLKTKSALDYKQRVISYMAGTSYNVRRETFRPIANVMYSDVLGREKKLGLLFTASYSRSHKPRDSAGLQHEPTTDNSRPTWHFIRFAGEDQLEHERTGMGLTLDYKLGDATRVYLNTMWADYGDTLGRRRFQIAAPVARILPGWTDTVTETALHPQVTFNRLSQSRDRTNDTTGFKLGGETDLRFGRLDYSASYSVSNGLDLRTLGGALIAGVAFRFDRTRSREFPELIQIGGPDILNIENAVLNRAEDRAQAAKDRVWGGDLNFLTRPQTAVPTKLKTGLRYRRQEKTVDEDVDLFNNYLGAGGVTAFLERDYKYAPLDGLYTGWTFVDDHQVVESTRARPQDWVFDPLVSTRDDLRNDSAAEETVTAGYLMGEITLGRLSVLGGIRVEETRISGDGSVQEITPEERARRAAWTGPVTTDETVRRAIAEFGNRRQSSGKYRDLFPSLHFKYELGRGVLARASYSTGIGRPSFASLVPSTTVNHDSLTVTSNNINLKPQYADNFDVFLEYYFEPAGALSAGVFLKEISEFIYSDSGGFIPAGNDNGFGGLYEGYELRSNFNGGFARVRGWEVSYQQQFSNLPGFWRGFGVFANYTRTETTGDYGQPGETVTSAALEDFAPSSTNAGVSYIARGWTIRVKWTRRKDTLQSFNANPAQRVYVTPCSPVDLNFRYDWKRRLSFFVDVINVFDVATSDHYLYTRDHPFRSEHFTTAVKFGVSGRY
jgi:iron complex outermembrane receptor protein